VNCYLYFIGELPPPPFPLDLQFWWCVAGSGRENLEPEPLHTTSFLGGFFAATSSQSADNCVANTPPPLLPPKCGKVWLAAEGTPWVPAQHRPLSWGLLCRQRQPQVGGGYMGVWFGFRL